MSKRLYAILQYEENCSIESISDECFNIVAEACKRKIAINEIHYHDYVDRFWFEREVMLGKNTVMLELSDSYIFCLAEEFLLNDLSIPETPHIERLGNLQGLFKVILDSTLVASVSVYMCTDYYEEDNFETVDCTLTDFAPVMREKLKTKLTYAYKCIFTR